MSKPKPAVLAKDEIILPHPAEDLSADDDLLSWILVDQLGCMPNSRLGVHPQENKFVGPVFKTDDVLQIVREIPSHSSTPRKQADRRSTGEIHSVSAGLTSANARHLRRYLLCYTPTSRVDIHSTDRYSHVTKHPELAVFATRPLPVDTVLQELQGSVVPLPAEWLAEMDLGDDYDMARAAAGHESDESEEEDEFEVQDEVEPVHRRKGKEVERGQRRSDRTRRRDFSIVWSGLKRCYQLFLGPARFLNHDCSPTVELLRQGKHVTFRIIRAVRIGEELTAYYLCLTCEQNQRGRFTVKTDPSRSTSEGRSETPMTPQKPKINRPSHLRRELRESNDSEASASDALEVDSAVPEVEEDEDEGEEDSDSDTPEPIVRAKLSRSAKTNAKPWTFLKRAKPSNSDTASSLVDDEDLPEDFPRCGSCAKPLHDRMWYAGRYFDHCARCTRHAFIFSLPWPAHRQSEVQEYPPSHLIPSGYIPRKISTIPLPSLQKKKFKEVHVEVPPDEPIPVSQEYRRQLRLRKEIAMEDFVVQSLRETAWTVQVAHEEAIVAAAARAAAKGEARRLAREEKVRRDANTLKGSGVWSRYEYVDDAELERRVAARNAPTNGTRRGKSFKVEEEEDDDVVLVEDRRKGPAQTAANGARVIHQITIPSEPKRKAKMDLAVKSRPSQPQSTTRPHTSPTLRLYVGSASGSKATSSKRPAEDTSPPSRSTKKPRNDVLPPAPREGHPKVISRPSLHRSQPSSSGTESTTSSSAFGSKRKRGRPKGSGKNQIAAAKAEEERRLSLSSSGAGPSRSSGSGSPVLVYSAPSRAAIAQAKKDMAWANEPVGDEDPDLEEGIEVIVNAKVTPHGALASDKAREKDKGGSGEKKVRSFFPSHLPILKLGLGR